MSFHLLTSSRRHFLRRLGLLATVSATPHVLGDTNARHHHAPGEPDWLREWNDLPRRPVRESRDSIVTACLQAAERGEALSVYYHGGTTPGRLRTFSPDLVFRVPLHEHRYVSGYCHLRHAPRILRADRMALG
ncbi:MAG: hypothetical protein HKN82_16620 [Akkermansiaceae bacterium]|nr:hypothetical protein [Akkermansiaceae bacterium]